MNLTAKWITELLWEVGIPMHLHGYHYLIDAIQISIHQSEMNINLSHEIYPNIARHYHTSASRVERSIRHAIELAWKRGNLAAVNGIFGRSLNLAYEKPSNGEMIAILTEKIRLRQLEESIDQTRQIASSDESTYDFSKSLFQ